MKYRARPGSGIDNETADVIGKTLAAMKNRTPEELLKKAKAKSSPLHELFEWDDKEAAHAHRIHQAQHYISSIEEISITTKRPVRSFLPIETELPDQTTYRKVANLLQDEKAHLQRHMLGTLKGHVRSIEGMGWQKNSKGWKSICDAITAMTL